MTEREDSIDVTPTPEILSVIAEVDMQIPQCVGELVDNCFDELVLAMLAIPGLEPRVDITVPTPGKVSESSTITVEDNGRGMTVEELQESLRAGSSGKKMHGSLGMFGMGFNIATARLGNTTEVRTGRSEDTEWVLATIDIREMQKHRTYRIPLRHEPKNVGEHGTAVTISRLKEDVRGKLAQSNLLSNLRSNLGRLYTYMLRQPDGAHSGAELMGGQGQALYLNGRAVTPFLPCIWDPSRTVSYKGSDVPAATKIDHTLQAATTCLDCGRWYTHRPEACVTCGGTNLETRERRIWGWIGVQRYPDKSDFGFSFLRQGRCIVTQDKSLFDWLSPDGERELEYPVELGMGRIVGEIHLDHASPNVRKTDFDRSGNDWLTMVHLVRGDGPLRPNIAKSRGYPENDSVMGKYFNAFRENRPGLKYLVTGNGQAATHEQAKLWANLFRKEEPDYLTDEKWYEQAKLHDDIKEGRQSQDQPAEPSTDEQDQWLQDQGLGHLTSNTDSDSAPTSPVADPEPPAPLPPETDDERFARYRGHARLLPDSGRDLTLDGANFRLSAYAIDGVDLIRAGRKAQYLVRTVAGEVEIYVDARSPLIRTFGIDALDAALMFAAPDLASLYGWDKPVDEVVVGLFEQFPDRRIEAPSVRAKAEALLGDMRERLTGQVQTEDADTVWRALSPGSRRDAENIAIGMSADIPWSQCVSSGEFVRYLPAQGIQDLVTEVPEMVLDGVLFKTTYDGLQPDTQQDQVARLAGYLADLCRMIEGPRSTKTIELSRFMLSADLLEAEIVTE